MVKVANHMAHDASPRKVFTNRSQNYGLYNSHLWIASLSLSADCKCESSGNLNVLETCSNVIISLYPFPIKIHG